MALGLILSSFFKALGQIGDRRFRRVLGIGIILTLALLVLAYAGLLMLLQGLFGDSATLPLIGEVTWIGQLLGWSSLVLMILLSVVLMVPVASAIISLFLEDVARAVEDRHYPHVAAPAPVPFWDTARDAVNFLGVLIVANILALVLYAFLAPMALFIFWGLNGYLLGREYFTLVAMRYLGRDGARQMRRRHAGAIWAAGVLMAMPLSVPLINLTVPILGAATFTHLYHGLRARGGGDSAG